MSSSTRRFDLGESDDDEVSAFSNEELLNIEHTSLRAQLDNLSGLQEQLYAGGSGGGGVGASQAGFRRFAELVATPWPAVEWQALSGELETIVENAKSIYAVLVDAGCTSNAHAVVEHTKRLLRVWKRCGVLAAQKPGDGAEDADGVSAGAARMEALAQLGVHAQRLYAWLDIGRRAVIENKRLLFTLKRLLSTYPDVHVDNFNSSFRDGKVLCALLHLADPTLIDMATLSRYDGYTNLKLAFAKAETHFGIPALLDASFFNTEDNGAEVDEEMVKAYVGLMLRAFYTSRRAAAGAGAEEQTDTEVALTTANEALVRENAELKASLATAKSGGGGGGGSTGYGGGGGGHGGGGGGGSSEHLQRKIDRLTAELNERTQAAQRREKELVAENERLRGGKTGVGGGGGGGAPADAAHDKVLRDKYTAVVDKLEARKTEVIELSKQLRDARKQIAAFKTQFVSNRTGGGATGGRDVSSAANKIPEQVGEERHNLNVLEKNVVRFVTDLRRWILDKYTGRLEEGGRWQAKSDEEKNGMTYTEWFHYLNHILFVESRILNQAMESDSRSIIYKQSWMKKKGQTRHNWKRRWFVLQGNVLFYYTDVDSTQEKGALNLGDSGDIELNDELGDDQLRFHLRTDARTLHLRAENMEDKRDWIHILANRIYAIRYVNRTRKLGDVIDPRVLQLFSDENISEVAIDNTPLSLTAVKAIVNILMQHRATESFSLRNAKLENLQLEELCKLFAMPSLKRVYLSGNNFGSQAGAALATAIGNPKCAVEEVYVDGNQLGDDGVEALLACVNDNESLRVLSLSRNGITDRGVKVFVERVRNTKLRSVDLADNILTDVSAALIAELCTANGTITTVALDGNDIRAEGAAALAKMLVANSSITSLTLARNNLRADGVKAFYDVVKQNATLQTLVLHGNHMTTDEILGLSAQFEISELAFTRAGAP